MLENKKNMDVFTALNDAADSDEAEKTILIADDETDILYALQLVLVSEGYRVLVCGNGRDAWAMVQEHHPDLVLTDIMMPYMSGIDVLHRMRSLQDTQDIPVILMSCVKPTNIQGVDSRHNYISKPFLLDKLLDLIRDQLDQDSDIRAPKTESNQIGL